MARHGYMGTFPCHLFRATSHAIECFLQILGVVRTAKFFQRLSHGRDVFSFSTRLVTWRILSHCQGWYARLGNPYSLADNLYLRIIEAAFVFSCILDGSIQGASPYGIKKKPGATRSEIHTHQCREIVSTFPAIYVKQPRPKS